MGCAMAEMVVIKVKNVLKLLLSTMAANASAVLTMINIRKLTPKLRILGKQLDFLMVYFEAHR